jgi:hypothetical protein
MVTEFHCQLGMCAITTSLWGNLRYLVRNCLPKNILDVLYSKDQKVNFKVEVNSFFGWAISDIHQTLVDELNETEFDVEESVVQARLDFVGRMRYFDHQAAQNKTYHEECYDGIYRLQNCGGLTLVSPQYFEFGKSLMQVIVNSLGMKHFNIIGSEAVKKLHVYIEKNVESLTRQFLECDKSFTAISRKEKAEILDRLVEKTCNAQQSIIVKARSAESTKRGGSNYAGLAHRAEMAATKEGSKAAKELKLKKKEK